ncbi:MAG: leucyl aminopeptidase [Bacteroidia bacterium]|nr:leucyl aminopeptidase [Bacteroidia bacterium]
MKIQFDLSRKEQSFAKTYFTFDRTSLGGIPLSDAETAYARKQLKENDLVILNRYNELVFVVFADALKDKGIFPEQCRKRGNEISGILRQEKIREIDIVLPETKPEAGIAVAEGLALGSYQFVKYRSANDKKQWNLEKVNLVGTKISKIDINLLAVMVESVFIARDLVNEPGSHLNAVKLAESFEEMGKSAGFTSDIFHKDKIEKLKMGGLLAVNQGSIDPPTFSVLKWEPADAKNTKPIVLVGKGVVYDTGGLSLKPTKDSMDYMKCDMAGGAVVAAVMYYAAKCQLPLHLIALVPSTDNRPDGNAYAPGDIVYMHSGQTVEVLNTDAEGRLLLADALSFAKDYHPKLVIDIATLTGAAAMAIGHHGIVMMGNAGEEIFSALKLSGENVFERIVEFPLWEEYGESIKSDIADMKNIGEREAGSITAGKFLEKFVDYPWIHLDIAGPAFLNTSDHYRTRGGTASGVRLLIDFLRHLV